ncbi:MAG TPA: hypothetical protein VMU17_01370, partial [Elusimicrobiota bacterium]|nr:hypothetical protein [Elusimicrobiota bacterium]
MPVHSWSRAARLLLIAALLSDSGRTLAWGDPIRTARPLPAEISNIHAQALIPWVELARRTIFGDNAVRGGRSAGFQSLEKPLVAMTFDSQPADEFRALLFALHAVRGKGLDDGRVKDLENRLQRMMQRLFYQSVPQAEDWEPLREVFERIWPIILPAEFFDNAGGIRNRDDFIRRMEAVPGVASLVDQLVIRTLRAHEDGVIDRWVGDYIFRGGPWQARDPDPEIPYPTDLDYGIRRTLTADDRTGLQAFRRETIREFLRGLFGFITATVPEGGATDWRSDPERAFQAGFDAVAARHGPDDWSALRYGGLVKMQNSPASDPIAETTYAIMGRLQEAQKLYRAGRLLKAMEELDNAIYGNIRIHATGLVAMTQTTLTASLLRSAQAYKQEIDEVYQGWVKDHLDRVQREGADAFSIGWRMADFYLKIARASRPGGPDARQRQIDAAINTFGREMRSVLHPESGTLNPEAVERMYQLVIGMKLALAESNHRAEAAEALKWIEGDVTLLQNGLPDAARYPGDEVLWTAVARSTLASGDGSMLAALLHVPERARSFFHSLTDPIDQDRFMRRMVEAWAAHDDRPVEEIFAAQPKLIGILQGCRSEWERQGLETLVKHADAILAHVAPPPKFREDPAFLAKARARLQWAEELLRRGQTRGAIRAVIPWLVMDMTPSGDQTPAQRLAALDRHPNVDLDQRLDARGIMENAQALFYEAKGVQEQWPLKHLENVAREANPETPGTRTPLATALMLLNYYRQFSDRQKDAALRRLSWRASRLVRKELAIDKVKGYAIFDAVDLFQRLAGADWDLLQGVRGLWPSEIQTRPIRMRDAIRDGVMTGNADVLIQLAGQPEVSDQLFEEARKLWAPEDFKDMMVLLASAYEPARQEAIRSILRRQAGPQRMGLLTFLDDFSEIQRNYKPSIS